MANPATTPTPTKTAAAKTAADKASRKTGAAVIPAADLPRPKVESYDIASSADTLDMAKDLAKFIKDNKLSTSVQGKDYVNVEGWQYAGSRLGIVPIVEHVINVSTEQEMKYQSKVTLWDLRSQHTVGAGFAVCSNKESGKKFWQEFAVMSMSQTRATGKAFRNVLAWLIRAAGYEPTPAEEMDWDTNHATKPHVQPLTEADHAQAQQAAPGKSVMPAGSNSAPLAVSAGAGPSSAPVMAVAKDEPATGEHVEPHRYATASQKEEIIRLLNHPVVTRQEKTKMLLNINRLDEDRAAQAITKLRKAIDDRENSGEGGEWAQQLKDFIKVNKDQLGFDESVRLTKLAYDPASTHGDLKMALLAARAVVSTEAPAA